MELKYEHPGELRRAQESSNRTFMELKSIYNIFSKFKTAKF